MSDLTNIPDAIADIADEFIQRIRDGESPQVADYEQQYPDMAQAIRDILPALAVIEKLKPSSSDENATQDEPLQNTDSPTQIGEFQIVREIGRGGMGVVYEAIQQSLQRRVALKVLPYQVIRNQTRLARFDREARAAARLHHTNIVPVFDFGTGEGVHYFAMQFINGLTLDQVLLEIKRVKEDDPDIFDQPIEWTHGPQTGDETLRTQLADTIRNSGSANTLDVDSERGIVYGSGYCDNIARLGAHVARALEYAHQQGVLHRDIKPSNLILDTTGNIWVTDFGLATTEEDEALTKTGEVLGTIRYMAPEVFNGVADQRSDIYSLGITLFEMLALRPAFEEKNRRRLIRMILNESPQKLRSIDPSIPRDLETIVHKAIERDPNQRYPTATSFADDLNRFLLGKPIRARRVSPLAHLSRWIVRNPVSASLTAAVLLLLVSTAVISTVAAIKLNTIANERSIALQSAIESEKRANQLSKKETNARKDAEIQLLRAERIEKFMKRTLRSPSLDFDGKEVTIYQVLKRTLGEIDDELGDDPEVKVLALLSIHDAFLGLDEVPDALEVIKQADKLSAEIYDENHYQRITVRHLVGTTQRLAGKLQDALNTLERAHRDSRDALGPFDGLTIQIADELAITLFRLGREEESTRLFEQNYANAQQAFGPAHRVTLECLHNQSTRYQNSRNPERAIPILQEAWQLRAEHLGETNQATLNSRVSLGGAMRDAKQTRQAILFLTETLAVCQKHLGEKHTITLTCLNNLALALADSGQMDDAIKALEKVEKGRLETKGDRHPAVLTVQSNLANMLMFTGNIDRAIDVLKKSRPITVHIFGADHWRSYRIASDLAVALRRGGKLSDAVDVSKEAFNGRYTIYANDKLESVIAKVNMATVLCDAGLADEAAYIFCAAIDPTQLRFGENSRQVRNILRWHHQCLMAQRDWDDVIANSIQWKKCIDADEKVSRSERCWRQIDTAYAFLLNDNQEHAKPNVDFVIKEYQDIEPEGHMQAWSQHTHGLLMAKEGQTNDAEPILQNSSNTLIALNDSIPAKDKFRQTFAVENMIWFYTNIKPDPEKAKHWQKQLEIVVMPNSQ